MSIDYLDDENVRKKIDQSLNNTLNREFAVGDVVEFSACSGSFFEIVEGSSPFWKLHHFAGPPLPANYHETCFGKKPPEMDTVIESILVKANPMEVMAIVYDEAVNPPDGAPPKPDP